MGVKVGVLSGGQRQAMALLMSTMTPIEFLILDEPTSSLDDDEVAKLFKLMNRLKDEGVGIIFVTHFLEQVYEVCDRITVLRNGELVGEYEVKDLPRVMLVAKMMGKDFDDLADIKGDHAELKEFIPVIEAEGLSHKGTIKPFDITINKGEVIGLTGLLGSGRSELVRAIYGADKADTGTLKVKGKEVKINTPLDAMKLGMAYLPEDRKAEGIIADLSVRENIIIALQAKRGMFHPLSKKEMEDAADKYIKLLQIKTASRETPIKSLSGGNQQKVILGRWLLTNPDYLILDEPTRGVDVNAKFDGKLKCKKKIVYMPQDPTLLFVKDQLFEDLLEMGKEKEVKIDKLLEMADLMREKKSHPYDLSGGQQQMAALIKVLLADPEILLLDEPTKGMDREHSRKFGELLRKLTDQGKTIFIVSHDLEFCAEYADRVGMMFDGKIEGIDEPSKFFAQNYFYTTECAKITRDFEKVIILPQEVVSVC